MTISKRPLAFWLITGFLILSLILLVMGQTMAIINYDFAVQLGLQESVYEVGQFGVQLNRAFGASDTLIYIPLIIFSIVGLMLKKSWSLFTTAAVMGISSYWATTSVFLLNFLIGIPNYHLQPDTVYWLILSVYIFSGISGLLYLAFKGDQLLS